MRSSTWWFGLLCAISACDRTDNSGVTAKAESDLHNARAEVAVKANQVVTSQSALDREQRELEIAKNQVAADSKSLEQKRGQLGAAQETALLAQTTYNAALIERLAKLDAGLATLATKPDAASKDAFVGLQARRSRVDTSPSTSLTPSEWTERTARLDVTLTAIEKDLHAAL